MKNESMPEEQKEDWKSSSGSLPQIYIPTLYFAEGLPYTIVAFMSTIYFKAAGESNTDIAYITSLLAFPWTVKFLWAPLLDFFGRKRTWLLVSQLVLAVLCFLLAASAFAPNVMRTASLVMGVIALVSATHDIAIDSYYLEVLNTHQQAFYVGWRNTAYRISMIAGQGGLVVLAGILSEKFNLAVGWSAAFAICGAILLVAWLFHSYYLPKNTYTDITAGRAESKAESTMDNAKETFRASSFIHAILSYFQQAGAFWIVSYILLFRLGDAFLMKQATNFLQDSLAKGGLGFSVQQVGLIYGTVGVCFLLAGGVIGGWLLARDGLKKWFWPATILQNLSLLLYYYLSLQKPALPVVLGVNCFEQFAYGVGISAYTVFILQTVKKQYRAAHYATATGIMAFGMLVAGALSGYFCDRFGYSQFFLFSFFASIPGMITVYFLPIWRHQSESKQSYTGSQEG